MGFRMNKQLPRPSDNCPICGGETVTYVAYSVGENLGLLGRRYSYVRCNNCHVISQYPLPDKSLLNSYYSLIDAKQEDWYASAQGQSFLEKVKARQHRHAPLLKKLIRYVAAAGEQVFPYWRHLKPGLVVDLGAGLGAFCLEAGKRGFSVRGIEQSGSSVSLASQLGVDMIQADLASSQARNLIGSAQNVVMNHVFEHVLDPISFLSDLRMLMKPNANLILLIPNPNSIWRFIFGRAWYGWDPPVHVHHYSSKAMKKILLEAGYELLCLRSVRRNDSLATALNHVGFNPWPFSLFYRILMIPVMPLLALLGLGPELLCVARVVRNPQCILDSTFNN